MSTEFFASTIGGPAPRVLARFVTDHHGLHVERLDRQERRWVHDASVVGFITGHDDWAERITRQRAEQIVGDWELDPALLHAPVIEPGNT